MRLSILTSAGLAAVAIGAAACSSTTSSSAGPSTTAPTAAASAPGQAAAGGPSAAGGQSALKTASIGGATVVTNAGGFTLYSFAPDTATASKCTGACAQIWPPVTGPATAGPGVTGTLGTLTRPGGATQASYDGHPLYTYTADTAPGQANGNGLNVNGGVWHEITASGTAPPATTSGGGSNGY